MYKSASLFFLTGLAMASVGMPLSAAADTDQDSSGYAVYGNWCGPNHPRDPATAGKPVDSLDAICKRHDICYIEEGDFNCHCDAALVKDIRREIDAGHYTGLQYQYARAIHNYFQGSPCEGDSKDKLLPSRLLHRAYNGVKEGVQLIREVFADENTPGKPLVPESDNTSKP